MENEMFSAFNFKLSRNDDLAFLIEAWQKSFEKMGIKFRWLTLGTDAAKSLDAGDPHSVNHLAQLLSDATGIHIVVEVIDDPQMPPSNAVWSDKSWEKRLADHIALNQ